MLYLVREIVAPAMHPLDKRLFQDDKGQQAPATQQDRIHGKTRGLTGENRMTLAKDDGHGAC